MPAINLAANETAEVDLTSLLGDVKNRPDLDVVSVQVINSGEPGSLIGSIYGINNKTGVNYEVPLRDSGPTRSMTGAYPWKITKDYTTIVYITNISDQEAGFVTQINHEGGKFVIDPRKLAPGETAMFDLQKIRDEQTEDNAGRHLPKDTSLGQFKWAVHSVTGGKIALIGRAEMVSRSQHVSTSYSCSEACPPTYGGTVNIPTFFFVTGSGTATASMTAYYGSGYTTGPYGATAEWSIDNSVATVNPFESVSSTTVTGQTPGSGNIYADMGLQDWYAYDGLNCIYNGSYPVGDGGPIDVTPQIGSLEPARGLIGSTTEVLITGKFGSSPNPTVQVAGTGVTATVSRSDSVEIRVNFEVATNATPGNHAVTVKINNMTSNSVNFFVQVPTALVIDVEGSPQTYSGGSVPGAGIQVCYGYVKILTYSVLDQSNVTTRAATTASEDVQVLRTNIGSQNKQGTSPVDSNGQFSDYIGLCFASPPPPQQGEFTVARQTIKILQGGATYTVRVNCLNQQYTNTSITNVTGNPTSCQ